MNPQYRVNTLTVLRPDLALQMFGQNHCIATDGFGMQIVSFVTDSRERAIELVRRLLDEDCPDVLSGCSLVKPIELWQVLHTARFRMPLLTRIKTHADLYRWSQVNFSNKRNAGADPMPIL